MSREEGHISQYRLWSFVNGVEELTDAQQTHLTNCIRCLELFKECVLTDDPRVVQPTVGHR